MDIPNQYYEDFIRMIIPSLKLINVSKDEVIYRIGEEQQQFYVLLNGQIDIFVPKTFKDVQDEIDIIKQEKVNFEKLKKKRRYDINEETTYVQDQKQKNEQIHLHIFQQIHEEKGKTRIFDINGVLLFKKLETLNSKGADFGFTAKKKAFAIGSYQLQDRKALILSISLDAIQQAKEMIQQQIDQKIIKIRPFLIGYHLQTIQRIYWHSEQFSFTRGQPIYKQNQNDSNIYLILDGEVDIVQKISPSQQILNEKLTRKKNFRYLKEIEENLAEEIPEFEEIALQQQVIANSVGNTLKKQETVRLSIFSQGQIFGEEDIFFNNYKRSSSAIASSQSLILLSIDYKLLEDEIHVEGFLENLKDRAKQKLQTRNEREEIIREANNNKLIFIKDQHPNEVINQFINEQKELAAQNQVQNNLSKIYSDKYLMEQQCEMIINDTNYQTERIMQASEENYKIFNNLPQDHFKLPNLIQYMYPEGKYKLPYDPSLFKLKTRYKIKYKKPYYQNRENQENTLDSLLNQSIPNKISLILQNSTYSHQRHPLLSNKKDVQNLFYKEMNLIPQTQISSINEEEIQNSQIKNNSILQTENPPFSNENSNLFNENLTFQNDHLSFLNEFPKFLTELSIIQDKEGNQNKINNTESLQDSIIQEIIQPKYTLRKSSSLNNLARLRRQNSISFYNIQRLKQEKIVQTERSQHKIQRDNSPDKSYKEEISFINLPIIQAPQEVPKKKRSISESNFKNLPKTFKQNVYIEKFIKMKSIAQNQISIQNKNDKKN